MNWKVRTVLVLSLGLSSSVGACQCLETRDARTGDLGRDGGGGRPSGKARLGRATIAPPSTGTGTSGSNGLDPRVYTKYQALLTKLMGLPLTDPSDAGALNRAWGEILDQDQDAGATLVSYTIECAVRPGAVLTYTTDGGKGLTFKGEGLINDTGAWLSTGLPPAKQANVHRCMAVRLNLKPENVWMEGSDITPAEVLDASAWPVPEGFWATTMNDPSDGGVSITYWPPTATDAGDNRFASGDQGNVDPLQIGRRCTSANPPPWCPFRPGAGGCSPQPDGGWTCFSTADAGAEAGLDAIETRLTCSTCCDCAYPTRTKFCEHNGCTCPKPCPDASTDR